MINAGRYVEGFVTVGQTLTEARSQAGLTVDELSERTRIRGTVIRSIEQDDYEACGGDLYVRGYVRALAGAVGIDAQPLIREYELGRAGQESERALGPAGRHAKGYPDEGTPGAPTAFDLPAVTGDPAAEADPGATRYDLPAVPSVPSAAVPPAAVPPAAAQPPGSADTRFDLPVVPPGPPAAVPPPPGPADTRFDLPPVTGDLMAAGYDLTPQQWPDQPGDSAAAMPAFSQDQTDAQGFTALPGALPSGTAQLDAAPPSDAAPRSGTVDPAAKRSASMRKSNRRAVAAAIFAVVALGALGVRLATAGPAHSTASAGASASAASASAAAAQARASAAAQASAAASASAAAQASASASAASASASAAQAAARAVTRLPIASAQAFGPDGFADGDDPGNAKTVISGGASQPWTTQWYATPEFGMLKHGTGLLLDMGGQVTVTSVAIDLSKYGGTSLQIRAGNGTASQDLRVAATASNVGGVVRLTLPRPVAARYLLIWFTQLPPDGAGHYQETVSQVQVTGRR
jgi:cytoskeletal protein RodZ